MEESDKPKVNKFKLWCVENSIKQVALQESTKLGIGTLHKMLNLGDASEKTIKLVAISLRDDFDMTITEDEISAMLGE